MQGKFHWGSFLALALSLLLLPVVASLHLDAKPIIGGHANATHRLYDGITAFVANAEGKGFSVTLDVRDLNFHETGPREVLVKIYDPDGRTVVREVIPDDGITAGAYQQAAGAFDHEAWYYVYCRAHGAPPMVRWSSFSEPKRLGALAKRTFTYKVPAGKAGIGYFLPAPPTTTQP